MRFLSALVFLKARERDGDRSANRGQGCCKPFPGQPGHDDIMPVFCSTSQTIIVKSAAASQADDSACAWGCFRGFCCPVPNGPDAALITAAKALLAAPQLSSF